MKATTRTKVGSSSVTKEAYEAIDVRQLVLKEATYKGRRITFSGVIMDSQSTEGTHFILMHVPVAGQPEMGEEVLVKYTGNAEGLIRGTETSAWGIAEGLQITSQSRSCGITVKPQIKAELLEW